MTYKEWSARPDLIERLSMQLRDETLQLALSVVEDIGIPRTRFRADAPNLMENHALLNAKREGYFECLANLKALANAKPRTDLDLSPWKHTSETEQ